MNKKTDLFVALAITFTALGVAYYAKAKIAPPQTRQAQARLMNFTEEELKKYDGENPNLPIYIAMDGEVYDVSAGRKFYEPGGSYHSLAGRDATAELRTFGGDAIRRKYPVVGRLTK